MPRGDVSARIQLREAGLRVTRPRQAVLEWLTEHPHATAEQIGNGVREEHVETVSTQAVYDVLEAAVQAGLVRRFEPERHPAHFERRTGDNHHHLVCRACGRIDDVDCLVGTRLCLTPRDTSGYELDEAEVVFWGICVDCGNSTAPRSTSSSIETSQH